MELVRGLHNINDKHRGCVLTIGNFDGVHLGHQKVLQQVVAQAKSLGLPSVVMTFEPQPYEYFSQEQAPARLMRLREKIYALLQQGVDYVFCLPFNAKTRHLSATDFIEQVLLDGLAVRYLVVGDDFRFGCDRKGDYALLQQWGERSGFAVNDTPTHCLGDLRISSTRVRQLLVEGHFDQAATLLGQPYCISGRVTHGNKLGRTIGVPTANMHLRRYSAPLSGVFAVKVKLSDGQYYYGVANVGVKPTVGGITRPILEVHLFEFDQDIYGQQISVTFVQKLRDEQKFADFGALTAQIARDISQAKQLFGLEA